VTPTVAPVVKAVVRNAEAKTGGLVLCDQGDSGIWKEADAALTKLKLAAVTAASNLANAKTPYDAQVKEVGLMLKAKNDHASENTTYATALSTAKQAKEAWAVKAGVTITTAEGSAAKLALLNTEKGKTTAAGALVDKQLLRVEKLVEAKRAQDKEEARWEERRAASAAMAAGIQKELDVATAWETRLKETFTTRSFLFQMLGKPIDQRELQTDWKNGCAFGPNAGSQSCELMEKGTASKSAPITFWWGICYNNATQNKAVPDSTNKVCAPHGLDDDAATTGAAADGLISVATAQTGVQNDTTGGSNTATQLFKVYETANYEYSAGTTKLADALTAYKAW